MSKRFSKRPLDVLVLLHRPWIKIAFVRQSHNKNCDSFFGGALLGPSGSLLPLRTPIPPGQKGASGLEEVVVVVAAVDPTSVRDARGSLQSQ